MNKIDIILKENKLSSITLDIHYEPNTTNLPVVLFVHGFKGFKDWGHFNLIAQEFVSKGFVFVKMNTSCNGTSPNSLTDFDNLEAFGKNTFSKEIDDINTVIKFIYNKINHYGGNPNNINLIGHSRGGGLAILVANSNKYISKLITWASVASFEYFFNSLDIKKWETDGVLYTYNSRTKQNMPLYFDLYKDYNENRDELDIPKAAISLNKAWLILHGDHDESVNKNAAYELQKYNSKATLKIIDNANHTFGGKHPFNEIMLPKSSLEIIVETVQFLFKQN